MKIKIDGKEFDATNQDTILDVAKRNGVDIPTLCHLKGFSPTSSCRICLVEVGGKLVTACSFGVSEGLEVITQSDRIKKARKTNLELLLSNHNFNCDSCIKDGACGLQSLAQEYEADENKFFGQKTNCAIDSSSNMIVRDNSKCILCKKCVEVCKFSQAVGVLGENKRGFETQIGCAFLDPLKNSECVGCGQCVMVCPTGALSEKQNLVDVQNLLNSKTKVKIACVAPAVRVAIKEEFGLKSVREAEEIIPALLKALGFDKVFDVNFSADLTVVEEAKEFVERIKANKNLPLFTSCCPAWVDYVNKFYPEFKKNISSCLSPLLMFGVVAKSYWAQMSGTYEDNISVVSIMPCTAKKGEIEKSNVDICLTVRELLYLIKKAKIDIKSLKPVAFDSLMSKSSGAGVIFGTSGGVMEASLRTVAETLAGKELKKVDYQTVRGLEGTKIATLFLANREIRVAVVSGLMNAKKLLEKIKHKKLDVHFVEVMACEGGCINGGGMPYKTEDTNINARMNSLYGLDQEREIRKSHKNPEVLAFYEWQQKQKDKTHLHRG